MAKGYSLDALVQEKWSRHAAPLDGGIDFNDFYGVEKSGIHMVDSNIKATTILNIPEKVAGVLEVVPWTPSGLSVQRYTTYDQARLYIRTRGDIGSNWGRWKLQIDATNVFDTIYPIGIVLQFDNATNPNNTFTGTVWKQITDGRAARAATGPEAGTADGQIGSVAGSDSVSIAVDNLPRHTHDLSQHTHSIGAHTHTMRHSHTIDHDHGGVSTNTTGDHNHSLSGNTSANGDHSHSITVCENDGTGAAIADSDGGGIKRTTGTGGAGNHSHDIRGTANTAGNHSHYVDLPNFSGNSGGCSASSTGGTALTTGGPSNNTSDVTGGDKNLDVRNSSHYYAFWKRVA